MIRSSGDCVHIHFPNIYFNRGRHIRRPQLANISKCKTNFGNLYRPSMLYAGDHIILLQEMPTTLIRQNTAAIHFTCQYPTLLTKFKQIVTCYACNKDQLQYFPHTRNKIFGSDDASSE